MNRIVLCIVIVLSSINLRVYAQDASSTANIDNLVSQQKYHQAIKLVDQKLIKKIDDLKLLHLKALLFQRLNSNNKAIKTYQLIIKLYPGFPDAYNNLAGIFAKQGELELAKNLLEKGIETNKTYALLHNNIKNIYLEMARESYVKALRLGVKKHDIELAYANIDQYGQYEKYNNQYTNNVTASSNILSVVSNLETPISRVNKTKKNQKLAIQKTSKTPVVNKQNSLGPKKTIRRISKKKIVVAGWSEPVISVKDEVISALQGWAAAWSAQDVDLYLSFYNKHFLPENGITKNIWISQRQTRLLKPRWIEVQLSNFSIKQQTDDQAVVNVTQIYRSNSFRDKSKKKFLLKRSFDGWQILNEINF